jgi:hypothetical protein
MFEALSAVTGNMWLALLRVLFLVGCLAYSLILKKEAVLSSEVFELLSDTRLDIPDDVTLYLYP